METFREASTERVDNWKARTVGFVLILLNVVLHVVDQNVALYARITQLVGAGTVFIMLVVIHILIAIWVSNIVAKLNRNVLFWVLFALIAAPLCLIIVGYLSAKKTTPTKKKARDIMIVGGVTIQEDIEKDEVGRTEKKNYDSNICPACGFSITNTMDVCPDCEITLK